VALQKRGGGLNEKKAGEGVDWKRRKTGFSISKYSSIELVAVKLCGCGKK